MAETARTQFLEEDDIGKHLNFRDTSRWVRRRGVPVFDECAYEDETGQVRRFSRDRLEEMAETANRLEIETGQPVPLNIGHTKPGQLARRVGFARGFRVAPFGKTGRQAIVADLFIERKHEQEALAHPRRSITLHEAANEIEDVSLLGARTPARDLGLLMFSREEQKPSNRLRSIEDENADLREQVRVAEIFSQELARKYSKEGRPTMAKDPNENQSALPDMKVAKLMAAAAGISVDEFVRQWHQLGVRPAGPYGDGYEYRLRPSSQTPPDRGTPDGSPGALAEKYHTLAPGYDPAPRQYSRYARAEGPHRYSRDIGQSGSDRYKPECYDRAMDLAMSGDPEIERIPADKRFAVCLQRVVNDQSW
jgi:hypothetical protein